MGSDLTFEFTEFFQDRQQRFEAALTFAICRIEAGCGIDFEASVKDADALLAVLNETDVEEKP